MAEVVSHATPLLAFLAAESFCHSATDTAFLQEQPLPDRKQRKSVAFSDGNTLIDENGEMTTTTDQGEDKTTAESHTSGEQDIRRLCGATLTPNSHW